MDRLRKLWGTIKEPVEELVKRVFHKASDPLIEEPETYLVPRLPEKVRPKVEAFLADEECRETVVEILRAAQCAILDVIEDINPGDNEDDGAE